MNEEYKNNQDNQGNNNQGSYWDKPFDYEHGSSDEISFDEFSSDKAMDDKRKNIQKDPLKKINVKKYKDIGGLTLRKLNIGLWYVEHKKRLRMALIGFLLSVSAVSWAYTIYGFAYYLNRGMAEDELMARQIVNSGIISHDTILSLSAKDLLFYQPEISKSSDNRYDFFVKIDNINKRHGAEFIYYFKVQGKETERYDGFILPGESKYLLSLSNEFNFKPNNAELNIENFRWIRIDRHKISDWSIYRDKHLDFKITGADFISAGQIGRSDEIKLNSLEFTAANNTIYNYWNVDFVIFLYNGSGIVSVNKYRFDEFMSGQERYVTINWPGNIGRVSKITVTPEINILRDDIYIRHKGGVGDKK